MTKIDPAILSQDASTPIELARFENRYAGLRAPAPYQLEQEFAGAHTANSAAEEVRPAGQPGHGSDFLRRHEPRDRAHPMNRHCWSWSATCWRKSRLQPNVKRGQAESSHSHGAVAPQPSSTNLHPSISPPGSRASSNLERRCRLISRSRRYGHPPVYAPPAAAREKTATRCLPPFHRTAGTPRPCHRPIRRGSQHQIISQF